MIRARDVMYRHRSDSESYRLLPEDEMQRQQLLRLLQQRENDSSSIDQKPSSAEASQSTFRIDLPDSLRRMETRLTAPRHVYERRNNERNNNISERSFSFSSMSPFSSSTRRARQSPYESIPEDQTRDGPPQLPHLPPMATEQLIPERNFSQSTQTTVPPYTPGEVEAPIEKRGEIADLTGEVHPLERELHQQQQLERERARPQYRVIDAPPNERLLSPSPKKKGPGANRQRSTSRESRRAEIELEREGGRRAELEGVRVSPRIMRVESETGQWTRR